MIAEYHALVTFAETLDMLLSRFIPNTNLLFLFVDNRLRQVCRFEDMADFRNRIVIAQMTYYGLSFIMMKPPVLGGTTHYKYMLHHVHHLWTNPIWCMWRGAAVIHDRHLVAAGPMANLTADSNFQWWTHSVQSGTLEHSGAQMAVEKMEKAWGGPPVLVEDPGCWLIVAYYCCSGRSDSEPSMFVLSEEDDWQ